MDVYWEMIVLRFVHRPGMAGTAITERESSKSTNADNVFFIIYSKGIFDLSVNQIIGSEMPQIFW